MRGGQRYQANLVGVVENQDILRPVSVLVEAVQLGVVPRGHTSVVLWGGRLYAVFYGRNPLDILRRCAGGSLRHLLARREDNLRLTERAGQESGGAESVLLSLCITTRCQTFEHWIGLV